MFLIPAAGVALPVCVLWGLVGRSPYGLSLARWYAGLRVVLHFAALVLHDSADDFGTVIVGQCKHILYRCG